MVETIEKQTALLFYSAETAGAISDVASEREAGSRVFVNTGERITRDGNANYVSDLRWTKR